jgi:hypothetical protein
VITSDDVTLDVRHVAFSADGQHVAVVTDLPTFRVYVWRLTDGQLLASTGDNDPIEGIAFDPLTPLRLLSWSAEGVTFWTMVESYRKFSLKSTHVFRVHRG